VLVVTFDEHGGFFDHVAPPRIPYVGPGFRFDSAGVRVPAVVASPFVAAGSVCHALLDHTSILQLLTERFGEIDADTGAAVPFSEQVAYRRRCGIRSVSAALDVRAARPAPPPLCPQVSAELFVPGEQGITLPPEGEPTADEQAYDAALKKLFAEHPDVAREIFSP
jgi:phospholipase C